MLSVYLYAKKRENRTNDYECVMVGTVDLLACAVVVGRKTCISSSSSLERILYIVRKTFHKHCSEISYRIEQISEPFQAFFFRSRKMIMRLIITRASERETVENERFNDEQASTTGPVFTVEAHNFR